MSNDFYNLLGKYAAEFHSLGLDNRKFKPKPRYNYLIEGYSFGGYAENVPITHLRAGIFDMDGVVNNPDLVLPIPLNKGPTFLYFGNLREINTTFKNKFATFGEIVHELAKVKDLQIPFNKLSVFLRECGFNQIQHKKAIEMTVDFIKEEPNYFVKNLPETFLKLSSDYAFALGIFSGGPRDLVREIAGMMDGMKAAFGYDIPFNKNGDIVGIIRHTLNDNKARGRDIFLSDTIGRRDGRYVAFSDDYILDEALKNSAGLAKLGVNLNPVGWITDSPRNILPGDVVSPLPEARKNFSAIIDLIDRYDSRVVEFHFLSLEKQIELWDLALKFKKESSSIFSEENRTQKFEKIFSYVDKMNLLKGITSSLTISDLMRVRHEIEDKDFNNETIKEFNRFVEEHFPEPSEKEEKILELRNLATQLIVHPDYSKVKIRNRNF